MEDIYYKWFEGGGAIIKEKSKGFYNLYEVPPYGGDEQYEGTYKSIEEAKRIADTWT